MSSSALINVSVQDLGGLVFSVFGFHGLPGQACAKESTLKVTSRNLRRPVTNKTKPHLHTI